LRLVRSWISGGFATVEVDQWAAALVVAVAVDVEVEVEEKVAVAVELDVLRAWAAAAVAAEVALELVVMEVVDSPACPSDAAVLSDSHFDLLFPPPPRPPRE